MSGFAGSCTTAPKDNVPSWSVIGFHDVPPFVDRHTPPLLKTEKIVVSVVPRGSIALSTADREFGPGSWPLSDTEGSTFAGPGPICVHCNALPPYGACVCEPPR